VRTPHGVDAMQSAYGPCRAPLPPRQHRLCDGPTTERDSGRRFALQMRRVGPEAVSARFVDDIVRESFTRNGDVNDLRTPIRSAYVPTRPHQATGESTLWGR